MGNEMLYPIFFHHKIFINGEQIFLDDNRIENLKQILNESKQILNESNLYLLELLNLETIKKIYEDIIPKDAVFSINSIEINENNFFNSDLIECFKNNKVLNIYSPKYIINKKNNFSSDSFTNLKLLEKNDKFILYEYPLKDYIDYNYSIIIVGTKEDNINFINGFLNFLFDINENDQFRLKLESFDDQTNENDIIDIKFINSKKGIFKFNCIDTSYEINLKDIEKLIEFFKNEKFINIILFNMNNYEYKLDINEILNIYYKTEDSEKSNIFFACPNHIHFLLKFGYLEKINFIENLMNSEANKELLKDTILDVANIDELLRQEFPSCFFNYDCIYDINKNKSLFFLYKITMKGYSYFLEIIKQKNNFVDTSFFIYYLNTIQDKLTIVNDKIENLNEEKEKEEKIKEEKELNKANLIKEIENQEKEINNIENEIKIKTDEKNNKINSLKNDIENLRNNKINIDKKKLFLIPINSKEPEKKFLNNEMTNVCHICKFNCHINCQENKSFCKSIQLGFDGFKCKICPNKCKLDSHEKVSYQYPTYKYKTIDNILKLYIQNKKIFVSSDSKIEYIIKKKEEEIKNFQDIFISDNNKLEKQINIKKEIFKQLNIEKNNSENIILT